MSAIVVIGVSGDSIEPRDAVYLDDMGLWRRAKTPLQMRQSYIVPEPVERQNLLLGDGVVIK
jgi:hypothetical protein